MKAVVIGGGPAGLVTLKYLATAHKFYPGLGPIDAQLFEKADSIGGVFAHRVWKGAEMVSSKYLTAFSDFRLPSSSPDFLSAEEYVQYLNDYVTHFNLRKCIHCNTPVTNVRRYETDGHVRHVVTASPQDGPETEVECDVVVVCAGLNESSFHREAVLKNQLASSNCRVIFSNDFKNKDGVENEFLPTTHDGPSTVVVLGVGETAHDIAALAVQHPKVARVVMCHRDGFMVAPKIVPIPVVCQIHHKDHPRRLTNKPLDTTVASLFDTAYVPPILQRSQLLWGVYDLWIKWMFTLISGTSAGIDQWAGGYQGDRAHADSVFLVKSQKAMPYISAPFRNKNLAWREKVRRWLINIPIPDTGDKVIELAPWPTKVKREESASGGGAVMEFKNDGSLESEELKKKPAVKPDVVIVATGFTSSFTFLGEDYPELRECRECTGAWGMYKGRLEDGFAYIGFVRPAIGAIPPLAELQAMLFVSRYIEYHMSLSNPPHERVHQALDAQERKERDKRNAIPPYHLDYALHGRGGRNLFREKHGVDHESFAYQLALDMGAAPKASYVLREHGWKVFFTWAMGPNFNTKFRLVGPWAAPKQAAEIMRGELYGIVKQTGGIVFFVTYTVVPFVIFGIMSLVIMAGTAVLDTASGMVGMVRTLLI